MDAMQAARPGRAGNLRRIWLCADDYGIASGVSTAIRDLIGLGRLNATSVMVVAPSFGRDAAAALSAVAEDAAKPAVGLHLTLTAPFRPMSRDFTPRRGEAFPGLSELLRLALLRQLDRRALAAEIAGQLDAFAAAFGRPPDFVDGHQHVQLFPQIRDEVLGAVKRAAPRAWLRQCGSARPLRRLAGDRKGLLLAWLSRAVRRRAAVNGIRFNPAFAGTYDFRPGTDFAALFPGFLEDIPAGGLVMCHPGHVDQELRRLDPLTDLREQEYRYLASDAFPATLDAHGLTLR